MNSHLQSKPLSASLVVRLAEQSFATLGPIKCQTRAMSAQPGHTATPLGARVSIQSLGQHDPRQKTYYKVTQTMCLGKSKAFVNEK